MTYDAIQDDMVWEIRMPRSLVLIVLCALQAALDVRGEELSRMERELTNLQAEVAVLKTADSRKNDRIAELEAEIVALRAENDELRTELARRRGGRPRKETTDL